MSDNNLLKRYEHMVGLMGELSYHLPEVMQHFDDMRLAAMLESTLDAPTKNLVGLGLAIATGAQGWIEHFTIRAMQSGVDREQVLEIIGVALLMGGGAVMMDACDAYESLQAYELREREYRNEVQQDEVAAGFRRGTAAADDDAFARAAR